jgi:hypothetical protein
MASGLMPCYEKTLALADVCVNRIGKEGTMVLGCQHFIGHGQAIDDDLWKTLGH